MLVVDEPNLRLLAHGRWSLQTTMRVRLDDGTEIEIPAGTETDLASSRVGRWNFLSIEATASYESIVHDALYASGIVSRMTADRIFYNGLRANSTVSWYDAWKAWVGVRSFGWLPWKNHRNNDPNGPKVKLFAAKQSADDEQRMELLGR